MTRATLTMTSEQHVALFQHLFPGDHLEAVAVLLCGRRAGSGVHRLLVHDVLLVPYEACLVRLKDQVSWSTDVLDEFLARATRDGFALVKIHSHPGALECFSATDDKADRELYSSLYAWVDRDAIHASTVMLPDGRIFGRVVHENGRFSPLENVTIVGEDIVVFDAPELNSSESIGGIGERLAQAFGKRTLARLMRLKIGIVGCSGTGSLVVEQLARNCVGSLVLVDPDAVEERNLNRIVNATMADVGQPKVDVLSRAVDRIGLGTEVRALRMDVRNPYAVRELGECDVLFGCVDGVVGRHLLNRIASYYLIPYFDMGVRIGVDEPGNIIGVEAAANYLRPGGSSLLSRSLYTREEMRAAFMKESNPEQYKQLRAEGYIPGIIENRPAVISVNMLAASMAVNDLLARLHGFREAGNAGFDRQVMSLYLGVYDASSETERCLMFSHCVGRGDETPLLGMPELSEASP